MGATAPHPLRRRFDHQSTYRPDAPSSATAMAVPDPESTLDQGHERLNKAIALTALVLLLPLTVLIGLAIKVTSKGPIIYCQARVGLDRRRRLNAHGGYRRIRDLGGAPFRIYKFRTMSVDAEQGSGAVWATQDDDRVTSVGRILRKARLDELPQLINVLRGEMSIVGPRPERPAIFADLRDKVPDYELRQRTRPGITGLAQINQPYDTCIDDVRRKVEYDLEYIRRRGVFEDLRIMIRTIPVVLFRRGGW